ncbi:hypothetical protein IQ264_05520 [Phormidium sp. LEGE 05292]|uniref:hypothetical protein n=1 Tax=[Phormidium] sp. LEGE 05292 TaxID=767427 RepID=UPI00187F74BF|nr:hypothetical protein [Phormidium sp. LEGE 05292]MBE9224923.1 hypothetical protein [Phormidium sp. LEGE 05292]
MANPIELLAGLTCYSLGAISYILLTQVASYLHQGILLRCLRFVTTGIRAKTTQQRT